MTSLNNKNLASFIACLFLFTFFWSCHPGTSFVKKNGQLDPVVVTDNVPHDTDDPCIWYNQENPAKSIVFGTDKEIEGGIYAFDLNGKIIQDKCILDLQYPNNVDLVQGVEFNGNKMDILVTGEREANQFRLYSVPDMNPIDGGGIPAFADAKNIAYRRPMGVAMYKNPNNGKVYLISSRKEGPKENYLYQYELNYIDGEIKLLEPRKFGAFSGTGEIEAIMVDHEFGYIYYSDEAFGIQKYFADPAKGNQLVSTFGRDNFTEDREGIALWPKEGGTGYIIVSDQQRFSFNVYDRISNEFIKKITLKTIETDGCDILNAPLGNVFPNGVFVAMTEGKVFHYYDLEELERLLAK